LPFAPTELRSVDRAAEKLAHQPNGVVVQHVALAIPGDLIDLIPEDHLLDTAAIYAVMFSKRLPEMARSPKHGQSGMCRGIKIQLFFVVYPSALRFLDTDSVAMWLRPPLAVPLRQSFLDPCRRHKMSSNALYRIFLRAPAGRQALTAFDSEPRVKSDNRYMHKQRRG
jgi:hypothetical protein